ncbi:GH3 family [Dillenia turbinata]|uniref:GH3 family n=1 Tax=Dillenia turbinata TaxID=194707 RepID=A0AAN8V0U3_9MAGN
MPVASKSGEQCNDDKDKKALEFIEDVTMNADEVQQPVLSEILSRNANELIPVVTHDHLPQDIARIAIGDTFTNSMLSTCIGIFDQSMSSQLLCGLLQNMKVVLVGAVIASGFIRAIKFREKHWTSLCIDIQSGTLDPRISNPLVRESVSKILRPILNSRPLLRLRVVEKHGEASFLGYGLKLYTLML